MKNKNFLKITFAKLIILSLFTLFTFSTANAQLRQTETWMVTLRNYMATLQESDFDVTLSEATYDRSYYEKSPGVLDHDKIFCEWLDFTDGFPKQRGLQVPSKAFTLAEIENGGVKMNVSDLGMADETAWWAATPFVGNPHYGSTAVKLRAFVNFAAYINQIHGNWSRHDFGGDFTVLVAAYDMVKDILPANVQAASLVPIRAGAVYLMNKGATDIHEDMDRHAGHGIAVAVKLLNEQVLYDQYDDYSETLNAKTLSHGIGPSHGNNPDVSYGGIWIHFAIYEALFADHANPTHAVNVVSKFKRLMTFFEPDGHGVSPTGMSTTTADYAPTDQWRNKARDYMAAMLSDEALYLLLHGAKKDSRVFPSPEEMLTGIQNNIGALTTSTVNVTSRDWARKHWRFSRAFFSRGCRRHPGFYDRARSLVLNNDKRTQAPYQRNEVWFELLKSETYNDFFFANLVNFNAVISTNKTSWWNKANLRAGFGGPGRIDLFHTDKGGVFLKSENRGNNNKNWKANWDNVYDWATHSAAGENHVGQTFSTAGLRKNTNSYDIKSNKTTITASGKIASGTSYTVEGSGDTIDMDFQRTFIVQERGIRVDEEYKANGVNKLKNFWLTLPIYHGDASRQKNSPKRLQVIEILQNGSWSPKTNGLMTNVSAIKLKKFDDEIFIVFDDPQTIKFTDIITNSYQTKSEINNLLVKLKPGAIDTIEDFSGTVNIGYEIRTVFQVETEAPSAPSNLRTN